jgi:hypothetical protein
VTIVIESGAWPVHDGLSLLLTDSLTTP